MVFGLWVWKTCKLTIKNTEKVKYWNKTWKRRQMNRWKFSSETLIIQVAGSGPKKEKYTNISQRNASIFSKRLHSIAVIVLDYSNPYGAHMLNITATGGAYIHLQNKWKYLCLSFLLAHTIRQLFLLHSLCAKTNLEFILHVRNCCWWKW